MRVFEILLLAGLLPSFAGLFMSRQRRPRWLRYLPVVGVVVVALHLLTEGYRWQMVPGYVFTAAFLLSLLWALAKRDLPAGAPHEPLPASRWRTAFRITGAVAGLFAFGLAALIPAAMPVFELPDPSGDFRVGTTRFSLVDSSRLEIFTADPSDKRELLIQAWYPAVLSARSVPERLWGYPGEIAPRLARSVGLPSFLFDHFALIKTHSYRDAALASGRSTYPVLLFSHAYNLGMPPQNTVQMEELASHGYVVFSIGHSYESLALVHADGRVVTVNEQQMRRAGEQVGSAGPLFNRLVASQDAAERAELLRQIVDVASIVNASVAIWVADTRFLLDELTRLDGTEEPRAFAGRLDLTRVGIFGMSFGGVVAADVCLVDSRCRAGINIDGLQYGAAGLPESALKVPFLFMTSESAGLMNEPVFQRAQNDAWYLTVAGSTHTNYSDFSLVSPVFRRLGLLAPIEGQRMEKIMNAYLLAFFDQYLEGRDSPLLKDASPDYPEVVFQKRAGAAHD